jgi:hypothetical protein
MAKVHYSAHVSDQHLKVVLQRIAEALDRNISVHSGDRDAVVKGSNTRSLHLLHRAADFHVHGMSDEFVFGEMRRHLNVFDRSEGYEFIRHGQHTNTGGAHLHLGQYAGEHQGYVLFKTEGLSPDTGGHYTRDDVAITSGTPVAGPPNVHTCGTIIKSVGMHGSNERDDVRTLQHLLNGARDNLLRTNFPFEQFASLREDGIIGKHTLDAIKIFQRDVGGLPKPDCLVDPGGPTLRLLKLVAGGTSLGVPRGSGMRRSA